MPGMLQVCLQITGGGQGSGRGSESERAEEVGVAKASCFRRCEVRKFVITSVLSHRVVCLTKWVSHVFRAL